MMSASGSRIVVATMKDEGPYVLEWLAYYHLIGFDHFVVFTNDCWDTTPELLKAIGTHLGLVTHYNNDVPDFGPPVHHDPQRRAYLKALNLPCVRNAEFVLVADADEFLNIHSGNGTLNDLCAAAGPFDALSATWRLFGSDGHIHMSDDLVTAAFTACAALGPMTLDRQLGVKTLFRPWNVEKIGVHRPFHTAPVREGKLPIRWVNGSGENQYDHYRQLKWHATTQTDGRALVEMHHYPIKSADAFLVKARRGSANSYDTNRVNIEYWDRHDRNEEQNVSIQRHCPGLREILTKWFDKVPSLRRLHEDSLDVHRWIAEDMREILAKEEPSPLKRLGLAS